MGQNPTHEYTEEGVYTVSLKVTESDGDSDTMTKANYITVTKVNNPPFKPDNLSPSDGAADVSEDADLSWTGGDPDAGDTVTYDVYFGTSTSPPLVSENPPENTYDPGTLDHSTEYYWQIVATDYHGAMTEGEVWVFTTAAPDTPPIVSNPSATPDTILNDNGRPRIPGTNISQLCVTVTDDTEIDTVTIDLSPIGGPYEAQMTNIPGTDTWTITTNAVEGINIAHNLIVTATDTNGNSDSSVSIQLTILRRGDVDHDNDVDRADALAIKKYIKGLAPDPGVFIGDVYPATGDNVVDEMDVLYIREYVRGKADEP
jgi:PKD repeat protein